ncbi:MAG: biosynthetic-type acetolactate synthase large subunit [Chloroflexota bacterium]|nr:MAG: biosynthetic-type acetolactate synthase large subunit [Chloroflexota bacterium]
MPKLAGAQILWECLVREGVDTVFGYPGGAILPAYDAMLQYPIHHVLVRHEQGASHMADGYARASGRVGVCVGTSGPAATNMVTGLATAMMDSIPVVAITGQVGTKVIGSDAFQETDVTGVTLPVTKHNYLVTHVEDLAETIREAFYIARHGRPGPVLIDIPKDVQLAQTEFEYPTHPIHLPNERLLEKYVPQEYFARAAEMIAAAERPVILAGHGILLSGAMDEVMEFAEKTNTPVALTLLGIGGFPAEHPLCLGMMGMHGGAYVNEAIQNADLLLAMGMRFDDRVTGTLKTYSPHSKKIHFEIDPTEINKNVKVDVPLLGDLKESLQKLNPLVKAKRHDAWWEHLQRAMQEDPIRDVLDWESPDGLMSEHVVHDIWTATQGDAIVVTDVGQHQMWEAQYYLHNKPHTLITSGGLGTMGFALPAAIGAKFAQPHKEVWVIAGDGGFQMTMAELATIVQEKIKINIAILNNGYLGMVRQWQEFFYDARYCATPIFSPDFSKVADAYGIPGYVVDNRNDVMDVLDQARSLPGPALIEFRVKMEDAVYPMVPAGASLNEMIKREKIVQPA